MGSKRWVEGKKGGSWRCVAIHDKQRRYESFSGPRAATRADTWIKQTEAEMAAGTPAPTVRQGRVPLSGVVDAYVGIEGFQNATYTRSEWTPILEAAGREGRGVLAGHSPSTWPKEVSALRKIGSHFGWSFPILSITPDHILAWIYQLRKEGKKDGTIQKLVRQLQWLFKTASIDFDITFHVNPYDKAIEILNHKKPLADTHRERLIENDEYQRLMNIETRRSIIHLIIVFAYETAMRRSEVAALTWQDVDLKKRIARLKRTKTDKKTGKQGRVVPLSPVAIQALELLPVDRINTLDGSVFNMKEDSITQAFNRIAEKAGVDDVHFHDIRHTAVTRMIEVYGWGAEKVGPIVGMTEQTLRRYYHPKAEDRALEMARHQNATIDGEWEEVSQEPNQQDNYSDDLNAFLINKIEKGDPKMLELLAEYQSK